MQSNTLSTVNVEAKPDQEIKTSEDVKREYLQARKHFLQADNSLYSAFFANYIDLIEGDDKHIVEVFAQQQKILDDYYATLDKLLAYDQSNPTCNLEECDITAEEWRNPHPYYTKDSQSAREGKQWAREAITKLSDISLRDDATNEAAQSFTDQTMRCIVINRQKAIENLTDSILKKFRVAMIAEVQKRSHFPNYANRQFSKSTLVIANLDTLIIYLEALGSIKIITDELYNSLSNLDPGKKLATLKQVMLLEKNIYIQASKKFHDLMLTAFGVLRKTFAECKDNKKSTPKLLKIIASINAHRKRLGNETTRPACCFFSCFTNVSLKNKKIAFLDKLSTTISTGIEGKSSSLIIEELQKIITELQQKDNALYKDIVAGFFRHETRDIINLIIKANDVTADIMEDVKAPRFS